MGRSYNDENLRENGNSLLLLLSLIGSVVSVADKYQWMHDEDEQLINAVYVGFQFKEQCPGCINWRYLLAVICSYCHIIARFAVFSLIWGVCGGWWMGIYLVLLYVVTFVMLWYG